jgi:hypothetical protein
MRFLASWRGDGALISAMVPEGRYLFLFIYLSFSILFYRAMIMTLTHH